MEITLTGGSGDSVSTRTTTADTWPTRPSSAPSLSQTRGGRSPRPFLTNKQPPCPALGQGRAAALNGGHRPIWARWVRSRRRALFGESWGFGCKAAPAPPWVTHKARQCSPMERGAQASLHQAGGEPCKPLEQRDVSQGFPPACVYEPAYQTREKARTADCPQADVWHMCGLFAVQGLALPDVFTSCARV